MGARERRCTLRAPAPRTLARPRTCVCRMCLCLGCRPPPPPPVTLAVDTRRARTRVGRASTKSARWEGVYRPRIGCAKCARVGVRDLIILTTPKKHPGAGVTTSNDIGEKAK